MRDARGHDDAMEPSDLVIDPAIHPFARAGSWTSLKAERREGVTTLALVDLNGRRMWAGNRLFRIEAVREGVVLVGAISATASRLTIKPEKTGENWSLEACYDGPDCIRFRARGCGIRVVRTGPHDGSVLTMPVGDRVLRLQQGGFPHYAATAVRGTLTWQGQRILVNTFGHGKKPEISQILDVAPVDGEAELALENHLNQWRVRDYPRDFAACAADAMAEFARWCAATSAAPAEWAPARLTAAYTCWSSLVEPRGLVRRRVMLSSKNVMHSLWSWDCHFFALAHAGTQPDFAWEQWAVVYDHMDRDGGLPNLVNDVQAMWGFVAIPVGGWAYRRMAGANPTLATRERLHEAGRLLAAHTRWWFRFRDDDGDGLPEVHHPNDTGADNATDFDMGGPAISPPICAYLVAQMDCLAWIHAQLGHASDAEDWRRQADQLLERMIARLWNGAKFVTVRADDGAVNARSRSHHRFLPLVLGSRLPLAIRQTITSDLRAHLGPVGIASEDVDGPLYLPNSYWRGPVWSPPTVLVAEGLREAGETALADELARRYCANCARHGFWENYDPHTGQGLCDSGLPWTAAPFLSLASALGDKAGVGMAAGK
jgi:hypothetical protein